MATGSAANSPRFSAKAASCATLSGTKRSSICAVLRNQPRSNDLTSAVAVGLASMAATRSRTRASVTEPTTAGSPSRATTSSAAAAIASLFIKIPRRERSGRLEASGSSRTAARRSMRGQPSYDRAPCRTRWRSGLTMYIPKHFEQSDDGTLWDFIDAHAFGTLFTVTDGQPFASHLPFLIDRGKRLLHCHVARANPQWQHLAA